MTGEPMAEHELSITRRIEGASPRSFTASGPSGRANGGRPARTRPRWSYSSLGPVVAA